MDKNCMCFKSRFIFFLIAPLLLFLSLPVHAASVLDGFNPNANDTVYTSAVQADGKLLVGGAFTAIGGYQARHIARLNTDGSVDTTFIADADDDVYSIIVQSNGQILVGGAFTTVGGQTRNHIARLNTDGSAESGFTPEADKPVRAIALLLRGDIIIGGDFTTINSEERKHIARLSAGNGSLDPDYRPDADGSVYSLATQRNGKVIAGGNFTNIGGQDRGYIARLDDIDGSAETTLFNISANGAVRSILIQLDNKILIGGDFTTLTDQNGSHNRNRIALLDEDGDTDFNFNPNANDIVRSIVLQTDGKVLAGGDFTSIGGMSINHMARLNLEFGYADSGFTPDVNGIVHTITVQADEKIVIGGEFTTITPHSRNYLARLQTDGSVEADFISNNIVNSNNYASVSSIAVQSDGKTLVGGTFTQIGGENRHNLARLNSDGSVDTSFTADTNGTISSIVVQADNKILVGGDFTTIGGWPYSPYLARLNTDGSVDTSFVPDPNSVVHTIAVQGDGRIIVGGRFTRIAGMARKNLARLFSTGAGDESYTTTANGPVYALVVQSDGKLVVGGAFTEIGGEAQKYIARVDATGVVETTEFFKNDWGANKAVRALALQADGAILVGGDFTRIETTPGDFTGRNFIARLTADGDLDATFTTSANGAVHSIAVQADTKILVGGDFTTIDGQPRNSIARLQADGDIDNTFDPNANSTVRSIVVQSDGNILSGGDFSTINGQGRSRIARINSAGTVDSAFHPDATALSKEAISAIAVQGDGKYLIGGLFSHIDGIPSNHIARLNQDGTVDTTWNASVNGEVTSIVILSNGKILICGNFTSITDFYETLPRNSLARLYSNGTVDRTFNPIIHGQVYAIMEETTTDDINGDILLAGDFTSITMTTDATGAPLSDPIPEERPFMARLLNPDTPDNPDAPYPTLDAFNSDEANYPNDIVYTIATQTDGKILIGGDFTRIGTGASSVRSKMARLSTSGESDASFDPNANGTVRSIVVQPDGDILVGGDFTYIGNQTRNKIARLYSDSAKADEFAPNADASVRSIALQTDGKILAIGDFMNIGGESRSHIARLDPVLGGADDFNPSIDPLASVSAIALQKDGKVVVGGDFTAIDSQPKNMMARLSADSAALQEFTLSTDGTRITWRRSQSSPEVHDVVFYESANNIIWNKILKAATRTADGWQLEPGTLFHQQNRYLAVSAKTSGGFINGSTSSMQSVMQYFIDDYTLTITPQPTGGEVTSNLDGISCGSDCLYSYQADTTLTLTATPVQSGYVAFDGRDDYVFTQWGGEGMDCGTGKTASIPVLMDENRLCTANFVKAYTSLLLTAGNGSGTVGWDEENRIDGLAGDGKVYESGKKAYVTAVADDDSIFTGWTGDCSPGDDISPFELIMSADKTCTATFEPKRILTSTSIGEGTVTADRSYYAVGEMATLTATPNEGYFFIGWSGDCAGTDNPLLLLMDVNKTCNANFGAVDIPLGPGFSWNLFLPAIIKQQQEQQPEPEPGRILTVTLNNTLGTVTSSDNFINCPAGACSHRYGPGETVTLTATPSSAGIVFKGWLGTDINCPGTNPCTLTMDSNKDIGAQFNAQLSN